MVSGENQGAGAHGDGPRGGWLPVNRGAAFALRIGICPILLVDPGNPRRSRATDESVFEGELCGLEGAVVGERDFLERFARAVYTVWIVVELRYDDACRYIDDLDIYFIGDRDRPAAPFQVIRVPLEREVG